MQYDRLPSGEYLLIDVPYGQERITITIANLTPLELLDAPVTIDMSKVKQACFNAAHAIADWNGAGITNPLLLVSDRKAHRAVGNINVFIQKHLFDDALPKLTGEEQEDGSFMLLFDDGTEFLTEPISMLEMLDIQNSIEASGQTSRDRCAVYAQILPNWFGKAATPENLHSDRDHHGHLAAIDLFFTNFFRTESATPIEEGSLSNSHGDERGGDASLSNGMAQPPLVTVS